MWILFSVTLIFNVNLPNWNVHVSERVRECKMCNVIFINFDICNWMGILYFLTQTYIFWSNILNINIPGTVRGKAKMWNIAFIDFHTCYPIAPLHFWFHDNVLHFQGKQNLNCYISEMDYLEKINIEMYLLLKHRIFYMLNLQYSIWVYWLYYTWKFFQCQTRKNVNDNHEFYCMMELIDTS